MELSKDKKFLALVDRARKLWGDYSQIEQLHEEIGELLTAVGHIRRNKCTREDLLTEILDVEQMIMAVAHTFGFTPTEVENQRKRSLDRFEMNLVPTEAKTYAKIKHEGQKYGEKPYTYHLGMTVDILKEFHLDNDPEIIAAAWLHDVVEDTDATKEGITLLFGENVADIVYRVTDEPGNNRKERKANTYPKIKGHFGATVVKLADRLANWRAGTVANSKNFQKMYKKEMKSFYEGIWDDSLGIKVRILWNHLMTATDFESPSTETPSEDQNLTSE